MQMVVQNIEQTNSSEWFWGADAGFQVDVLLPSSECFWGADAGVSS